MHSYSNGDSWQKTIQLKHDFHHIGWPLCEEVRLNHKAHARRSLTLLTIKFLMFTVYCIGNRPVFYYTFSAFNQFEHRMKLIDLLIVNILSWPEPSLEERISGKLNYCYGAFYGKIVTGFYGKIQSHKSISIVLFWVFLCQVLHY